MTRFDLKYITTESHFYKEAVAIREKLFFKNMENSLDLINDDLESNGIHLVCLDNKKVIGMLNINDLFESKTRKSLSLLSILSLSLLGENAETIGFLESEDIGNIFFFYVTTYSY